MDFSWFFNDYIKHIHRLDWLQQVFQWLYQTHPSPRLTSPGFSMTISNIPITSTDFSRVFHDYVKHTPLQLTSADFSMTMSSTHLFHWLQQVFPWLCQAHISSTDLSRFFHHYIKHTHRLDWLHKVFAWLCQAHTSSTDFSRFFNHYIKHTHRFDWLQQVCSWLYQTYPSPRLTSASCSMTISNIPIVLTDFKRFFNNNI